MGRRWKIEFSHDPERCICYGCRRRREAAARRAARPRQVRVRSDETAEHISRLIASGWKRIEIAREARVSPAVVTKAQQPGRMLDERTAVAILAVEP